MITLISGQTSKFKLFNDENINPRRSRLGKEQTKIYFQYLDVLDADQPPTNQSNMLFNFAHCFNLPCHLILHIYRENWRFRDRVSRSKVGMFMKILNFYVFNKMVLDRKILWFPSKRGVNHLKRWRNGEVVGKKRIMNYSQKLWPGTANWLLYYSMCQGPFFHHKGAFNKNALLFLEIWLLLAEMYCPKV